MPDRPERPIRSFDVGLQHERTALAWERTAIAMMVAGVVFVRYASSHTSLVLEAIGLAQITFGSIVLVWAGAHYEELHGLLRSGTSVIHPTMAKTIGLATVVLSGIGLLVGILTVVT